MRLSKCSFAGQCTTQHNTYAHFNLITICAPCPVSRPLYDFKEALVTFTPSQRAHLYGSCKLRSMFPHNADQVQQQPLAEGGKVAREWRCRVHKHKDGACIIFQALQSCTVEHYGTAFAQQLAVGAAQKRWANAPPGAPHKPRSSQ